MEFTENQWVRLETLFEAPRDQIQETLAKLDELGAANPLNITYRDRGGWPISFGQAILLAADDEYRVVAVTDIDDVGVSVSTVWTGWVYGPQLFETAVFFLADDRSSSPDTTHYGSEEDARAGHREVVTMWSAGGERCPDCGVLFLPRRKFNSGNPVTVWLPECGCRETQNDGEVEAFVNRFVQQSGVNEND